MPKKLDPAALADFGPREPRTSPQNERLTARTNPAETIPQAGWPSREVNTAEVGQFTVRAPLVTIERFKALCKDDRRTYADMLEILMNNFENS